MALVKQASEQKATGAQSPFSSKMEVQMARQVLSFLNILECHQKAETCKLLADACRMMPADFYEAGLLEAAATGGPLSALYRNVPGAVFLVATPKKTWKQLAIESDLEPCTFCGKLTTWHSRRAARLHYGAVLTDIARPLLKIHETRSACPICCGNRLVMFQTGTTELRGAIDELIKGGFAHFEHCSPHRFGGGFLTEYVFVAAEVRAFQKERRKNFPVKE